MDSFAGSVLVLAVLCCLCRLYQLSLCSHTRAGLVAVSSGIAAIMLCWWMMVNSANLQTKSSESVRLWLCLDVSRSMLAEDVVPNRLTRGKQLLEQVRQSFPETPTAVLAFAGQPKIISPFTLDSSFLRSAIEQLSTESAPPGGSDVAAAIESIANTPVPAGVREIVLLVTDGGHTAVEENWNPPTQPGRTFCLVGIGDAKSEATIPWGDGFLSDRDGVVRTRLKEENLIAAARKTGGIYVPAGTRSVAIEEILQQAIAAQAPDLQEQGSLTDDWLVWSAVALVLLELTSRYFWQHSRPMTLNASGGLR